MTDRSSNTRPRSFLGTGWSFPPSFAAGGADVHMVSDAEDIHQSLQILLATQVGERTMNEGFGCNLDSAVFEELGQSLVNHIRSLITDAVTAYEPRIKLLGLDVSRHATQDSTLLIRLDYSIVATNARFNMVYPFYVNEATVPGAP